MLKVWWSLGNQSLPASERKICCWNWKQLRAQVVYGVYNVYRSHFYFVEHFVRYHRLSHEGKFFKSPRYLDADWSQDSSVGVVTRLWDKRPRNGCWIPGRDRDFCCIMSRFLWVPLSLYSVRAVGLSGQGEVSLLTFCLMSRLCMFAAISVRVLRHSSSWRGAELSTLPPSCLPR